MLTHSALWNKLLNLALAKGCEDCSACPDWANKVLFPRRGL